MIGHGESRRLIYDGVGLCSPGLWAPQDRFPAKGAALEIQTALDYELTKWGRGSKGGLNRIYEDFASGRILDDPFPPDATERLRGLLSRVSSDHRMVLSAQEELQEQPIDVLLLGSVLKALDDPDWAVMRQYAVGVPLGVGVEMRSLPIQDEVVAEGARVLGRALGMG